MTLHASEDIDPLPTQTFVFLIQVIIVSSVVIPGNGTSQLIIPQTYTGRSLRATLLTTFMQDIVKEVHDDDDDEQDNSDFPNLLPFLAGLLAGFLIRPLIMGCFESKESAPIPKQQPVQPVVTPQPVPQTVPTAQSVPVPVPSADRVVSVPRPPVVVTDRDRAELKAKSLRDKLSAFLLRSDDDIREAGLSAIAAKRAGNLVSARLYLTRRKLLQTRADTAQVRAQQALDMVAAIEDAKDNKKTLDAIESGTAMISDIMQGLDKEHVQLVLDENKEAQERVREVNRMLAADGEAEIGDEEFEVMMSELENEQTLAGTGEAAEVQKVPVETQNVPVQPSALEQAQNIPDVPSEIPQEPVVAVEPLQGEAEEEQEADEQLAAA